MIGVDNGKPVPWSRCLTNTFGSVEHSLIAAGAVDFEMVLAIKAANSGGLPHEGRCRNNDFEIFQSRVHRPVVNAGGAKKERKWQRPD